jgi:hypothetical protein
MALAVNLIPRRVDSFIIQWLVGVFEGTIIIGKTVCKESLLWL